MNRFMFFVLTFLVLFYLISFLRKKPGDAPSRKPLNLPKNPFRPKPDPRETWMQVYETESMDEARGLQARLQENEIECVVYEQGKKDIHGNAMIGVGIAVPKTAAAAAQRLISRSLS